MWGMGVQEKVIMIFVCYSAKMFQKDEIMGRLVVHFIKMASNMFLKVL